MLGQVLESERSVKDWIKLLKDNPDYRVRFRAAEALARLGDAAAVKPLMGVLGNDVENSVRGAAARALGVLGDRRAVSSLISALRNDVSVDVRSGAAIALGQIGDTRALKHLIFVLKRHKAEPARRSAALALGHFEDEKALSALTGSVKMDPSLEVRRSAALALQGHLDQFSASRRRSIEPIIQALLPDPVEEPPEAAMSDDAVPSTALDTLSKRKLTCRSCGKRITQKAKVCPKCEKPLSRCMICYKLIGPEDVYAACPQCGELAHLEHLQHWLTIKRVCPHCQQYLDPRRYRV
jgi:HEAT repeat protein